jgi:hypothetical protein
MTSDCRFSYITDTPLKTANIMETNQITFMPIVDKDMYVV